MAEAIAGGRYQTSGGAWVDAEGRPIAAPEPPKPAEPKATPKPAEPKGST